jgi:gamma-D-glutamyl-L-lysine dipeptidyl-peptidase
MNADPLEPGVTPRAALVRAGIVPLYTEPAAPATLISQLVLGMRVEILEQRANWRYVRGEDNYTGWLHYGYLQEGVEAWAAAWERGANGEAVVSLGADLVDAQGEPLLRAPWAARLIRTIRGEYLLPDGRQALLHAGEVIDLDRLHDRFPPRAESIIRTARRWIGTPYLWGGLTRAGADCSGFAQAVFWMHGIALPRDSYLQADAGAGVTINDFEALAPGDLLFFAEHSERVSHVAISMGGSRVIHAAVTNGAVAVDDLASIAPFPQRLRDTFVRARRLLPG